jgi:hypothetical protein
MLSSLGSHSKELKQQGAVEAAQDENDPVTAKDAEKFMVDESKKGGAAAFQFDPDASPEEKAAQAGAVRNLVLLFPFKTTNYLQIYSIFPQVFIARPSPESVLRLTSYVPSCQRRYDGHRY